MNQNFQNGGYPQPPTQSNYYQSIKGLSLVCAVISVLLAAPILAEVTEDFAREFILSYYGDFGKEYLEGGVILWKLLCTAIIFYLSRAFVTGLIVSLGIALAGRFPALIV
jgi:hypothetical protein